MSLRGTLVKSKSLSDLGDDSIMIENNANNNKNSKALTYRFDHHESIASSSSSSNSQKKSWKLKLIDMIDSIENTCSRSSTEIKKRILPILIHNKNIPKLLFYSFASILATFYIYTHLHQQYHRTYQYSNAYDDSFGLFRHISNQHWKTLKDYYHSSNPHKFGDVDTFIDDPNVWFQYNWNKNFVCPQEERIGMISHDDTNGAGDSRGELGDGPKWVCNSRDIVRVVNDRMKPKSLDWARDAIGKVNGMNKHNHRANNGCLIYSIGVNAQNLGFEMGIQQMLTQEAENMIEGYEKGRPFCEIHVFDPDGYHEKLVIGDGIYYHNWGIKASSGIIGADDGDSSSSDEEEIRFKSFQQTVKELNHEGHIVDIMKVDCKMCEWSIFSDWFDNGHNHQNQEEFSDDEYEDSIDESSLSSTSSNYSGLAMIQQLLVEVHGTPEQVVNSFFERLRDENYVIFHKDANTEQFAGTSQDYAFLKLSKDFFKD